MVNLAEQTSEALLERLPDELTKKELILYMFEKNLVDKKRCQYALIKQYYFDLLQSNPDLKNIDAKEITAEDFGVSVSQVDKSIYYYTEVDL